jgi:hypothetical protein
MVQVRASMLASQSSNKKAPDMQTPRDRTVPAVGHPADPTLPIHAAANRRLRPAWSRYSASLALLFGLTSASAFGLNKGCVTGPAYGASAVFSGTTGSSAISITFKGQRAGTGDVTIFMGKIASPGVLSDVKTIGKVTTFAADGTFSKTLSVRRDGLTSGSAGGILWKNDDAIGFQLTETLNNTVTVLDSLGQQYGTVFTTNHGIVAMSDRPVASLFPSESSTTGCSNASPLPAGMFKCPSPFTAFPAAAGVVASAFLSRHATTLADADNYYAQFPGAEQYLTLANFKTSNGFSSSATDCKTNTANETCAWYRNEDELGFGRQMHCRVVATTGGGFPTPVKYACYVTNFKNENDAFNNTPNLQTDPTKAATFAMTWNKFPTNALGVPTNEFVRFYIYGSNGSRLKSAAVDSAGERFAPGLCMSCHGGNLVSTRVEGAHFLPFNESALPLPTGRANQTDAFKNLNSLTALVEQIQPNDVGSTHIRELINGWYANGAFDGGFVPLGWSGNRALYLGVVAPRCRACHISLTSGAGADFSSSSSAFPAARAIFEICSSRLMPHSQRMFQRFWESGAPAMLAAESGPLSTTETCAF